jgi:hypothetical protein
LGTVFASANGMRIVAGVVSRVHGLAHLARAPLGLRLGLAISLVSLAVCLVTWPAVKFGVPVNLVLITGMLIAARQTPAYMEAKFAQALKRARYPDLRE